MSKRGAIVGGGVAVLVALVAAIAWFGPFRGDGDGDDRPGVREGDPAAEAADAFAAAWQTGALDRVPATTASGPIAERTKAIVGGLASAGAVQPDVEVTALEAVVPPAHAPDDLPRRVRASHEVTWALSEDRSWTYDSAVELVEEEPADGGEREGERRARVRVHRRPPSSARWSGRPA